MRIAILGAGAMGSLYGSYLKKSGQEIVLVDIWPEHIKAINERGLTITDYKESETIAIEACKPEEIIGPIDLFILFTKTNHIDSALKSIVHLKERQTAIMTVQNGLGNVEKIIPYFDRSKILVGFSTFTSDLIGPGHIRSGKPGTTTIMQLKKDTSDLVNQTKNLLDNAGLNCVFKNDVFPMIWEKLAFNCAMNSITAATRLNVGQVGQSPQGRILVERIVDEVISVAQAKGLVVNKDNISKIIKNDIEINTEHKPSMLQDVLAGRETEIEAINGEVIREAENLGIPVTTTRVLYNLIKTIDNGLTGGERMQPGS